MDPGAGSTSGKPMQTYLTLLNIYCQHFLYVGHGSGIRIRIQLTKVEFTL